MPEKLCVEVAPDQEVTALVYPAPNHRRAESTADLYIVEDGDHSFKVLKRVGITQENTYRAMLDRIESWLRRTFAN
jgi:hypothetical protein